MIGRAGLIDAVPRQQRSLLALGRCRVLGEEVATIEALDRFNPLEQFGWLPSADEWLELRCLRKEIPHD